jgi:purine-cytosine permease-like protein
MALGVWPVPTEERTDAQFSKIFFIWFSANTNILSCVGSLAWAYSESDSVMLFRFSAGTLGPVIFGLGLRDTCLVILFFNLLCCALPAYLCVST